MKILIFSHSYPYSVQEEFLHKELSTEVVEAQNIDIFPLFKVMKSRHVEFKVLEPLFNSKLKTLLILIFGLKGNLNLFSKDWFISPKQTFKQFLIIKMVLNSKKLLKKLDEYDLFYFYWGTNFLSINPYFKKKSISRFHGYDLYCSGEYQQKHLPFRERNLKSLTVLAPISELGKEFLFNKYGFDNIKVARLGVKRNFVKKLTKENRFRVVSCSSVIDLKRVQLIFETLNLMKLDIEWIHFGGGVGLELLKKKVSEKRKGFEVILKGQTANDEVLRFYRENYIDVFLNFSSTEGIPVSAMEALSSSIPLFLSDVGGNSELIENSGLLFSVHLSAPEISTKLEEYLNSELILEHRKSALEVWAKKFDANKNYIEFYNMLSEM